MKRGKIVLFWFRFPYPLLVTPPDIQQERRFQRDEKEISRKNRNTETSKFCYILLIRHLPLPSVVGGLIERAM